MRSFLMAGVLAMSAVACGGAKAPDPNNELPFGFIDAPAANSPVSPKMVALGWAMDNTGVARIDLYVNSKFKASVTPTISRVDVGRAFPAYARDGNIYGWQIELDLGQEAGPRQILAQAVDTLGATRDIGVVNVMVAAPPK